jgi:hypothetical protein
MTGENPPSFVKGYNFENLSDIEILALQDWAATNVRPYWLTGIGLLDAAEKQVQEAVDNGNIPSPEKTKVCENPPETLRST